MASIVAEVLTSAGQLSAQEARSKLQILSKQIDNLKTQLHDATVSKYANFVPNLRTAEKLATEVQLVKQEIDEVSIKIENEIKSQLNLSTGEFQYLTAQLQDVNALMVILQKLVKLQEGLDNVGHAVRVQDYGTAADTIYSIQSLLAESVFGHEHELQIMLAIRTECHVQKEKLLFDLGDRWKELVQWNIQEDGTKNDAIHKIELKLFKTGVNSKVVENIISGMNKLDILNEKLKRFGEQLLDHMLRPMITRADCKNQVSVTEQAKVFSISYKNCSNPSPPSPPDMFSRLYQSLLLLQENLFCVKIDDGEETLLERLGEIVAGELLEMTVKECLIPAIPTSTKELEKFGEVIQLTKDTHKELLELHFIKDSNTTLLDYVQNVNVLFANKKCQGILEEARKLMTSEIHNTMLVTNDKPLGDLPPIMHVHTNKKAKKLELAPEVQLSPNTFRLPTCLISTCVQQLMTMAYETLQEASESSPQCAVQMYYAIRNMFELFCCVFPTYHKQSLEKLPQLSALHYNNCMFISHHLMTLGHQFSKKLPQNISTTFVDLVPKIRRLGAESFLQQLAQQKAQLLEYLQAASGFQSVSEEERFIVADKSIKQVLHQLQHLKNVWQEVLPSTNFRKAMGTLLNAIIAELTDSVVSLEDISADDAKHLSGLVSRITANAQELMQIEGGESINVSVELQRNVSKWNRFKELDLVLNANLLEISDRWSAGKGPLAVEFTATEVKQLIRALFQNTERRANVLAKIK
ncbi:hypothetical protein CHS0354_041595 [Potamilus streckersoni]|uniref:Centromere/kinetochore protein zw10 homolog n=1 Tax=Potamilus streckersoni TaxID=2493646 RepID=A0AAE0SH03_9BIVA|nr:hypothetical protein CHS0354_041595 [Potamilus streckersoni]